MGGQRWGFVGIGAEGGGGWTPMTAVDGWMDGLLPARLLAIDFPLMKVNYNNDLINSGALRLYGFPH